MEIKSGDKLRDVSTFSFRVSGSPGLVMKAVSGG